MKSPEFQLFLPLISRAGAYDERAMISGYGETTGYISYTLAEKAGLAYISRLADGDELNVSLSIMTLKSISIDASMIVDENWEGVK